MSFGRLSQFSSYFRSGLGWSYMHQKKYKHASKCFKKSLSRYETSSAHLGLGSSLLKLKEHDLAIMSFERSIKLKVSWLAYRELGWALLYRIKYSRAIEMFNKSIAIKKHWRSYQGLGWSILKNENKSLEELPGEYYLMIGSYKSFNYIEYSNSYEGLNVLIPTF